MENQLRCRQASPSSSNDGRMPTTAYLPVIKDYLNRLQHGGFPASRAEADAFNAALYEANSLSNPPPPGFQAARKLLLTNVRSNIVPLWARRNIVWEKKFHDVHRLWEKKKAAEAVNKKCPKEKPEAAAEPKKIRISEKTSDEVLSTESEKEEEPPSSKKKEKRRPMFRVLDYPTNYPITPRQPLSAVQQGEALVNRELSAMRGILVAMKTMLQDRDAALRGKDKQMMQQLEDFKAMFEVCQQQEEEEKMERKARRKQKEQQLGTFETPPSSPKMWPTADLGNFRLQAIDQVQASLLHEKEKEEAISTAKSSSSRCSSIASTVIASSFSSGSISTFSIKNLLS